MIFVIIWFVCALESFWLWARITYNDGDAITKRDFKRRSGHLRQTWHM